MKENKIYVFFDWTLTINQLIKDNRLDLPVFDKFVAALERVSSTFGKDVVFYVVSGTSRSSAESKFDILKQGFANSGKSDMFGGFAYEYGGYLISQDKKTRRLYWSKTRLGKRITTLSKKYGFQKSEDLKLYYNFEFSEMGEMQRRFIDECKNSFKDKDFEVYSDQYGHGLDIKNKNLNKNRFVNIVLKNNPAYMVLVGGDSIQDRRMLNLKTKCTKYFLGIDCHEKLEEKGLIFSEKANVFGIIDDLNKLCDMEVQNEKKQHRDLHF